MITLGGLCLVSELPRDLQRDEQGRLHCDNKPAIEWEDGFKLWYWLGVEVSRKLIEKPQSITKKDILDEKNAEKRRAIKERLGDHEFAQKLDLETIDQDTDQYKKPMSLHRTKQPDELVGSHLFFLKVTDTSTDREYYICVPPCENVWEAKELTFQGKNLAYRQGDVGLKNTSKNFSQPIIET